MKMRDTIDGPELAERDGSRARYTAIIKRFGTKRSFGHDSITILLSDVRDVEGTEVNDHLWFQCGHWTNSLCVGDYIAFDARVTSYAKGYAGRREDVIEDRGYGRSISHRLSNPTRVEKMEKDASYYVRWAGIKSTNRQQIEDADHEKFIDEERKRQFSLLRALANGTKIAQLAEVYLAAVKTERKAIRANLSDEEFMALCIAMQDVSTRRQKQRIRERKAMRKAMRDISAATL